MKQVEVRVIIVQCLEQDFIMDKHYDTVTLWTLLLLSGYSHTAEYAIHVVFMFWNNKPLSKRTDEAKVVRLDTFSLDCSPSEHIVLFINRLFSFPIYC